jgi:hypothetical protein
VLQQPAALLRAEALRNAGQDGLDAPKLAEERRLQPHELSLVLAGSQQRGNAY